MALTAGCGAAAWLGLFLLISFSAARAQTESLTELGEVIVSAPSADGTLRAVPHAVSVITAEDISRSTSTSVATY